VEYDKGTKVVGWSGPECGLATCRLSGNGRTESDLRTVFLSRLRQAVIKAADRSASSENRAELENMLGCQNAGVPSSDIYWLEDGGLGLRTGARFGKWDRRYVEMKEDSALLPLSLLEPFVKVDAPDLDF